MKTETYYIGCCQIENHWTKTNATTIAGAKRAASRRFRSSEYTAIEVAVKAGVMCFVPIAVRYGFNGWIWV